MPLYEFRTYTLHVGKTAELEQVYAEYGWPMLARYADRLVGYFLPEIGNMNQMIHIWRFQDEAERKAHWAAMYGDPDFMAFASRLRPLLQSQENRLMRHAPWGPAP